MDGWLTEDFSDAHVGERLAGLVAEEEDGSLTALEVAGAMHVSITLAQEFLEVSRSAVSQSEGEGRWSMAFQRGGLARVLHFFFFFFFF